jgi:ADP-ribose pyrophosphatase
MVIMDALLKFKGVVFNVVSRKIEIGGQVIQREVVEKRPCVVVLVKHRTKNTVIIAEEFRAGSMSIEWGFPAGIIDEGEIPKESAMREIKEETGYVPLFIEYLGSTYSSAGFTNEFIHYFYAEVDGEPGAQDLDGDESVKRIEIPFDKLPEAFTDGRINGNHAHTCYLKYLLQIKEGK